MTTTPARRWFRHGLTALVAVAATAATMAPVSATPRGGTPRAATTTYIVTLDPSNSDVAATARTQLAQAGAPRRPGRVFSAAIDGYTATLTPTQAARLATEPTVAAVEIDRTVTITDNQPHQAWTASRLTPTTTVPAPSAVTQTGAPWGLDRADQRSRPLTGTYTYTRTGAAVTAYIIDTGIRLTHTDFAGRATSGYDAIDGGIADDCNGHGTHVASTVAGTTYGIAKRANLVAVRVLGCTGSGTTSGVVAGMDWVVNHHQPGQPAVVNMSLGGSTSTALDAAVARLTADGITVVVAAGNSNTDASNNSPARAPTAITVAASDRNDNLASFSNYGTSVDIIAPGVSIPAAWHTTNTATNTISGTSMASPHVAGAAAKLLQTTPTATPTQITNTLTTTATPNTITNTRGTPNRLLHTTT